MKIGISTVLLDKENLDIVFNKVSNSNYDCIEINAETLPWAKPLSFPQNQTVKRTKVVYVITDALTMGPPGGS